MIRKLITKFIKREKKEDFDLAWQDIQNAAGRDALKALGPISKAEADYYRNLK
ncbi:hypothetical protein KAJ89_01330 [Candidatus Parcubacteria bacterium]|nr:hypothetical protein [Candidatus Parcubacteria bacterium]